jgi:hypothetical protein
MEDLERHQAAVYFPGRTGRTFEWDFLDEGKAVKVRTKGAISVDDADAYVLCGLQGMGLIQAARYQVGSHLASGALVEVLRELRPVPMPVPLLYPHGRASALKVSAFIGWLAEIFGRHPDFQDGSGQRRVCQPCVSSATVSRSATLRLPEQAACIFDIHDGHAQHHRHHSGHTDRSRRQRRGQGYRRHPATLGHLAGPDGVAALPRFAGAIHSADPHADPRHAG